MLIKCIAVGCGGFFGSIARYLISKIDFLHNGNYSINTLIVNLIGAVLIGIIISRSESSGMSEEKLLFLKVGLCGGLTTFSTFSYETWEYIQSGNVMMGIAYSVASLVLCLIGVMIGLRFG